MKRERAAALAAQCCCSDLLVMAAKGMQGPAGVGRPPGRGPQGRGHVWLAVAPSRGGVRPQGPLRASFRAVACSHHLTAANGGRAAAVWPRTWGRASGRVCWARHCFQAACKCWEVVVQGAAARLHVLGVPRAAHEDGTWLVPACIAPIASSERSIDLPAPIHGTRRPTQPPTADPSARTTPRCPSPSARRSASCRIALQPVGSAAGRRQRLWGAARAPPIPAAGRRPVHAPRFIPRGASAADFAPALPPPACQPRRLRNHGSAGAVHPSCAAANGVRRSGGRPSASCRAGQFHALAGHVPGPSG